MELTTVATWAWIPICIWAALAQTARNAVQRSLTERAGTLGATLVRFMYGLPFAGAWVVALHALPATAQAVPQFNAGYFAGIVVGGLAQIAATAFLLAAMKERNFVVAVTFSKTEVLQVALFSSVFLGELPGWLSLLAIAVATAGVVLLSAPAKAQGRVGDAGYVAPGQWGGRVAVYGLACGACFALSAVGYRGATLQLSGTSPWLVGAWGVLWAQAIQTAVLGGWLALREPRVLAVVATAWRISLVAGAAGALASIGWFTAFALRPAMDVRTLALVEVFFSYLVSRRLMREKLSRAEQAGLALVMAGVVLICMKL